MKVKGYRAIPGLEKLSAEEVKQRNLEAYGAKIKHYRTRAGLSADQLADLLDLSVSSVRNWECGLTRPDPEFLVRMFALLQVEPNEFFGLQGVGSLLTERERSLLESYRRMDEAGKEDLETLAESLSFRSRQRALRAACARMRPVRSLGRVVAAGDGEDWEEPAEESSLLLLNSAAVSRADEVFRVSGSSMEPQFHDQDLVLAEYCSALRNGDVGIFYVPGHGGVIKQVAYDRLHSLNPEYDDIFPYEDGARVIGRVLSRVTADMIPDTASRALYQEAAAL